MFAKINGTNGKIKIAFKIKSPHQIQIKREGRVLIG